MSDQLHGAPLIRRIVKEYRHVVIPLGIALVVNGIVYAAVVNPLAQRVANIEQRDRAAETSLAAARTEYAQVAGTLSGKGRATAGLATFYKDVLPQDLAGARRLTHLRLPQLARESGLKYVRGTYGTVEERGSTLERLKIEMVLSGSYADVRTFIHQLETAPEFVVIDNIELAEGFDATSSLVVTLRLSTYFQGQGK